MDSWTDENQIVRELSSQRLIIASGLISFLLVRIPLEVAQDTVKLAEWNKTTVPIRIFQLLFLLFLCYGIFWIVGSVLGLRVLAQNEKLQVQLAKQWIFQHPLLVQIIAFVEHGVMAGLYILLTGDEKRGAILMFLLVLHVLVALIFAPMMVQIRQ